jgi:hypothetical protein
MNTATQQIDEALDVYVAEKRHIYGTEPNYFRASDLAEIMGVPTESVSPLLQQHRVDPKSRFTIGHQGHYGRNAKWRILSKPGSNAVTIRRARVEHVKHMARDVALRYANDLQSELYPSLKGDGRRQFIEGVAKEFQKTLERAVERVLQRLNNS